MNFFLNPEILPGKSLSELPMTGCHVPWGGGTPVAARDSKGQGLTHEVCIGLPVLSPVAAHRHPLSVRAFNAHPHDISCARDVGD